VTRILSNYDLDLGEFYELKGANIFNINLKRIQDKIAARDSYIRSVYVTKRLPNEIYIRIEKRVPQARIDLGRIFLVDQAGFLLYSKNAELEEKLPLITGLRYRIPYPLSGRAYNIAELKLALSLIKEFGQTNLSRRCKIDQLDVSSIANASFFLENGPQIKIGDSLIKERIKMLEVFLKHFNWDLSKIAYIDLRFKEPAVKQK
jgi:cell division septal protein FtsQ